MSRFDGRVLFDIDTYKQYEDSDDQLAFMLSHEVAHLQSRHEQEREHKDRHRRTLQSPISTFCLAGTVCFAGTAPSIVLAGIMLCMQAAYMTPLKYVALQPGPLFDEADLVGLYMMIEAGYDPSSMAAKWRAMAVEAKRKKGPPYGTLGSGPKGTHFAKRLERVQKLMPRVRDVIRLGEVHATDESVSPFLRGDLKRWPAFVALREELRGKRSRASREANVKVPEAEFQALPLVEERHVL